MAPDLLIIKKMISNNEFGKVIAVELTVNNYRDDNYYKNGGYRGTWSVDGGGPFMQQASHYIDIYSWLFGKPEKVVSMFGTFLHNIETEDHGAALLRHSNGMIGSIVASTAAKPGFDARLEVHSEKGTFILENDIITTWKVDGKNNPSNTKDVKIFSGASNFAVTDTHLHEAIIKDFIYAVKENKHPFVNGKSARLTTEIILQIYSNRIS
jgi:UDP-N-acetyl-2-amino-2-deoxyglucuronate dehydrogenase